MKRREFIRIGSGVAGATMFGGLTSDWFGLYGNPLPNPDTNGDRVVPSFCELCFWKCGILAHVKNGRVTKIKFDRVSLEAVVSFVIDSKYDELPDDTDASILTADIETGARSFRLPTLSKRACTSNTSSASKSFCPVVCVARKNSAPIPSSTNNPVPASTVRVCCIALPQSNDAVIMKSRINTAMAVTTTVRVVARPTPSAVGIAL